MGFTCTEEIEIKKFGISLSGLQYTFRGKVNVDKIDEILDSEGTILTPAKYRLTSFCYVYSSLQAYQNKKSPLDVISVSIDSEIYPSSDILGNILYPHIKNLDQFQGKTLTDN